MSIGNHFEYWENYKLPVYGIICNKDLTNSYFVNIKFDSIDDYAEKEIVNTTTDTDFEKVEMSNSSDRVVIVQGSKNRIHDLLKEYDEDTDSFEQLFKGFGEIFVGIFFIYDVDHTSNKDLERMFNMYKDETSGMFLVSSPCIEILADTKRTEDLCVLHLDEYKNILNGIINPKTHNSIQNYIINNFEELMIHFIDKIFNESKLSNILEHPKFVIDKINIHNDRTAEDGSVIFRYLQQLYMSVLHI